MSGINHAFAAGYHCLAAWADLLDQINVFPVADGDTGANLRLSLSPLRDGKTTGPEAPDLLARCAMGNSGNIAAAFFAELCQAGGWSDLADAAARGGEKAWQALASPRSGTMLDVFDCLPPLLKDSSDPAAAYPALSASLQQAVRGTAEKLPDLTRAGVVDAGALGMYLFFEGFFRELAGHDSAPVSILELFKGKLRVSEAFHAQPTGSYCVNAIIHTAGNQEQTSTMLTGLGESVVMLPSESGLKVHVHTADRQVLRENLSFLGEIVHWSDEAMDKEINQFPAGPVNKQAIHIMTDAAGSITREEARRQGITLLDSYIVGSDSGRPESLCNPGEIYAMMRSGKKVGTAQASDSERHQWYRSVTQRFGRTLYLCVGSAFTGNYFAARRWKEKNDPDNLLEIIDTGAASGRLALIALRTACYAGQTDDPQQVVSFARRTLESCAEYVFIDELRYLVAGGRVSRTKAFLGDLLHMKPVISPTAAGVSKEGVVRNRQGQISFALEKLRDRYAEHSAPVILLQFSDNEEWVRQTVRPAIEELLPGAEMLLSPLSLTSGVHMGPGTWSVACCAT